MRVNNGGLLLLWGIVTLALSVAAAAESRNGSVGDTVCPERFYADGRRCIPIKDPERPSLSVAGQCPVGYAVRGKHCAARREVLPQGPDRRRRGGSGSGGSGDKGK